MTKRTDREVRDLAQQLREGVALVARRLRQTPDGPDLSLSEQRVLSRLDREGPASSAELARAEGITPQSMGSTVANLEGRELIGRAPDPGDGRRFILTITAEGRRAVRSGRDARTRRLVKALRDLDEADLRHLEAAAVLLERIGERL